MEEKDISDLEGWKKKLLSQPDEAVRYIDEMPEDVAEALAGDPEMGASLSAALRGRVRPEAGREGPAVEEGQAATRSGEASGVAAMRARKDKEEKEEQDKKLSLYAQIQRMDVGGKAKLARGGDKDARSILIKDGSKQVSLSVLDNPKITIQEIEMIAASRNVSEDILRTIGVNRDWCKSYTVILSLVNNPKTPVGVTLTHLPKILLRDLRFLAKSKGIPDVIKISAKKLVQKRSI